MLEHAFPNSIRAEEPLINPITRHPGESLDPVTFAQRTEVQRRWVPDIASRFRDDEQNQSFPESSRHERKYKDFFAVIRVHSRTICFPLR